jgi:hypothetical protein
MELASLRRLIAVIDTTTSPSASPVPLLLQKAEAAAWCEAALAAEADHPEAL